MTTMMQWVSFVIAPSWQDKINAVPISGGVSLRCPAVLISCHITPSVNNPVNFYAIHFQHRYWCNVRLQYRTWYECCLWQPHGMQESLCNPRFDWQDKQAYLETLLWFRDNIDLSLNQLQLGLQWDFIPEFWWDAWTVIRYIGSILNSLKQEDLSWNF